MAEQKNSLQLELIDLDEKVIKLMVVNQKNENIAENEFNYSDLNFTVEKIKEDILGFVEEKHFVLNPKIDFVVTSRDAYTSTFILPKTSKTKLFIENEIADKFGVNYKEKFCVYQKSSKFGKDGIVTFVALIAHEKIKFLQDICHALDFKIGAVTTISLNLYLQELQNETVKANAENHISLYVRDYYTVYNVVSNGELVSTVINEIGYNEIRKKNIVRRMDTILNINSKVISLAGFNELSLKNGSIYYFYLYINDEVVASQFLNKKLSIPYVVLNDEYKPAKFDDVFNLRTKPQKSSFLKKGFTLVEVIVSVAIFAILSVTMVTLLLQCQDLANKDELEVQKANFVMDLYERFKVMPEENYYINDFFKENNINDTSYNSATDQFYIDSHFLPVTDFADSYYTVKIENYNKHEETKSIFYKETIWMVNVDEGTSLNKTIFATTIKK